MTKQQLTHFIQSYISAYQQREEIATCYGEPLVGFADAWHPYIQSLRQVISPTHELPQNILPDAKIIIAYYVPFTKDLAKTNRNGANSVGSEVCGKCITGSPCAFWKLPSGGNEKA